MNTDLLAIAQPLCWAMEARNFVAMLHAAAPITTTSTVRVDRRDGVATIPLHGVIWRGAPRLAQLFLQIADPDQVAEAIVAAQADDTIQSVVLSVDSPGGTTSGVPELASTVAACTKPLTADVRGMAASAAYWICCGADTITARPSCQVGSIGVYSTFSDTSKLMKAAGVSIDVFKSAELKATGIPGTSLSAGQREYLQGQVDELFAMFTGHVNAHRSVGQDAFSGATWLAARAKEMGLIDSVAGEATKAPSGRTQAGVALVEEDCGAGLRRFRMAAPDTHTEHDRRGAELVRQGRAKICAVGVVSRWTAENFKKAN